MERFLKLVLLCICVITAPLISSGQEAAEHSHHSGHHETPSTETENPPTAESEHTDHPEEHAAHPAHGSGEGIALIGSLAWDIVKYNQPVFRKSLAHVHALPTDAKNWSHLHNWQGPFRKRFVLVAKNKFKNKAVHLEFVLQYYYGGQHDGKGRFLANVAVLPLQMKTSWGYKANVTASAGNPINRGTEDEPIAELPLSIQMDFSTIVKTEGRAINLRILGTGELIVDDQIAGSGPVVKSLN